MSVYDDGEVRQQFSVCFLCRPVGGELATSKESSGEGTSGIGSWWSSPSAGTWKDAVSDMIGGGYDVGIRAGQPRDGAMVVREIAPREVYNLAAISSVAQSWDEPDRTAHVNGQAAVALMESARQVGGVRFVQAFLKEVTP